jgi:hypothetical protein
MDLKPDPMELDMGVYWSEQVWDGDPNGDMTLEYEGDRWPVKRAVVCAQFPRINLELSRSESVSPSPFPVAFVLR